MQELNSGTCTPLPRKLYGGGHGVVPTVDDHLSRIERGQQGVGIY